MLSSRLLEYLARCTYPMFQEGIMAFTTTTTPTPTTTTTTITTTTTTIY
jgi:hypothetical protein